MLDDVNKGDMHFFTLTCNLKTGQNSEPAEADYSIGKTPINKPFPGGDPRETHLTGYSTTINGESIPTSSYPPDSTWQSAEYDLAYECFGFARYVYFYIFGYKESGSVKADWGIKTPPRTLVSADDARQYFFGTGGGNTITKVKRGSHIRINRKSGIPHSMIVCDFNGDGITVYHANWPHSNIVKITYFTWQEFVTSFPIIQYVTVDNGIFERHNFTGDYVTNLNGHHRKCVNIGCNKISDLEPHPVRIKITAYDHYSECSVCLYKWNYTLHSFTYTVSGTQHIKRCNICSYSVTEAHTLPASNSSYSSVQHGRKCVLCGMWTGLANHTISSTWTNNTTTHYKICTGCSYRVNEANHTFTYIVSGTQHIKKCNTCSYSITEAHTLPVANSSHSATQHGKQCTLCSTWTGLTNHTISSTWTNNTTTHYKTCTGCSYRANEANHTIIYAVSGTQHIKKCNTCSYSVTEAHTLPTANSLYSATQHGKQCTLCKTWAGLTGHTISAWITTNASTHYKICTGCSYQADSANHTFTYIVSGTQHIKRCNTCGYSLTEAHTLPTANSSYSSTQHGKQCTLCSTWAGLRNCS